MAPAASEIKGRKYCRPTPKMKQQLLTWLQGGAAALILSAAARALPKPEPKGSQFYLWLYNFAGYLLANFDRTTKPSQT